MLPVMLSRLIASNWQRKRYAGSFLGWGFLDIPGSRKTAHNHQFEPNATQDQYHHHSIVLVKPNIASKIIKRVFDPPDATTAKVDLGGRQQNPFRVTSPVQACYIQTLPTLDDIEYVSSYAAKGFRASMTISPDDSYFIFPGYA